MLAGVHGGRLVVVLGGIGDPLEAAQTVLEEFDDAAAGGGRLGPADRRRRRGHRDGAERAAGSGRLAGAPRPVSAEDLLPERTIAGDLDARHELLETVYQPLVEAGDVLLDTVVSYLDSGRALEATGGRCSCTPTRCATGYAGRLSCAGTHPTDARGPSPSSLPWCWAGSAATGSRVLPASRQVHRSRTRRTLRTPTGFRDDRARRTPAPQGLRTPGSDTPELAESLHWNRLHG